MKILKIHIHDFTESFKLMITVCVDVVYQWGAIMILFMSVSCVIVGDWEKSGVWAGGPKS